MPDPFTMAGDATWTDYRIEADVRFLSKSDAVVLGRIDSADVFQDDKARWPSGYGLSIAPDGSWELFSAKFKEAVTVLGKGSVEMDRTKWHQVELRFRGAQIEGLFDGRSVISISDVSHGHGMFALGSGWDRVQFDNVSVKGME